MQWAKRMTENAVFFSRCRPQGSEPIDLVLRERRVFIGYPAWRDDTEPRRGHLRDAVVDLWCTDEEWALFYNRSDKTDRKQYQRNRNFVQQIEPGAIALVPRPHQGLVYAGRVVTRFEMLDDPAWGEEYLRLRREQGCSEGSGEFSHLADVAHCCEVDQFRPLPFPLVPVWIRRSFFGRSTYGRIWPISELDLDPYPILDQLLDNPEWVARAWTDDAKEVERRLVDGIGPNTFEHLCVSLLQLEHPDQVWAHVGGSGDGGVDGIGAGADGKVVGLLQCKWAYYGEDVAPADKALHGTVRQVLAALVHPGDMLPIEGVDLWQRDHVASLVIKHSARLPIALSLRIGQPRGHTVDEITLDGKCSPG